MIQLDLIFDQLASLDATPFLLAILVGGMIGLEREIHGRPAGLRTHVLVCLSSALLVQASQSVPLSGELLAGTRVVLDPNRLAAGIVTGVGFLGAAAVIRSGDMVRGITTGACVWSVAGLGVVIGQEHYGLAIAGGAVMLLVLVLFDVIFRWVKPVVYRKLTVTGSGNELSVLGKEIREALESVQIRVQDLTAHVDTASDTFRLVFHVRCRSRIRAATTLEELRDIAGVTTLEWERLSE